MHRRTFLRAGLGAVGALGTLRTGLAADAEISLTPGQAGAEISPHIYGHFIEHLGGVIYDGIWVGRDSKIPNIDGIRKQFVDDMKRIGAPNLRWPGGCFADGYHWRDGLGGGAKRPRTYNYWERSMPAGVHATEPNQFGTHEFIRLCRLTGAVPYLAANVGSGSPQEFHDWVSYCNAPAGTLSLADERAANGSKEPFGVKYWGVGNESWGCGGTMQPQEYAALYRKFATAIPAYPPDPFLVACGPRGHNPDADLPWTTGFLEAMTGWRATLPDGFSMHFYTDFRPTKVKANDFDAAGWYEVFVKGRRADELIEAHWKIMGKYDQRRRMKFVIDEWGTWYPNGSEIAPPYILSQVITLRDAVHAAMTFDIFNRHADKIAMANIAQTINCLHSLFRAQGDKYVRTPAFHVFEMYRPHMGARLIPMEIRVPELTVPALDGTTKMAGLSGSASIRDKRIAVTLTNVSLDSPVPVRLQLNGAQVKEARGTVLTHADMRAANTFEKPEEVTPRPLAVTAASITVPKQSVVALDLLIA